MVVLATVASYIPLTIAVTERRGKVRKQMNKLDNDKEQRATDMLLCVETVKCFGMEPLELDRYGEAVDKFQVCPRASGHAFQHARPCLLLAGASIMTSKAARVG